jgi:hypothetical protein
MEYYGIELNSCNCDNAVHLMDRVFNSSKETSYRQTLRRKRSVEIQTMQYLI